MNEWTLPQNYNDISVRKNIQEMDEHTKKMSIVAMSSYLHYMKRISSWKCELLNHEHNR
jgi:hypothetical protein